MSIAEIVLANGLVDKKKMEQLPHLDIPHIEHIGTISALGQLPHIEHIGTTSALGHSARAHIEHIGSTLGW